MTKLGQRERETFMDIFREDFASIQSAVSSQIQNIWENVRQEILIQKGFDKLINRKNEIDMEIEKLQNEKHLIEKRITPPNLNKQQVLELGGEANKWGKATGANFYGISIESQLEYEIVHLIKKNINIDAPAKFLYDLHRSCMRELAMSGTFEEAQQVYEKFYALDFRKYGVDIPPRISEIKSRSPLLENKNSINIDYDIADPRPV